jgi:hypothetical protein
VAVKVLTGKTVKGKSRKGTDRKKGVKGESGALTGKRSEVNRHAVGG